MGTDRVLLLEFAIAAHPTGADSTTTPFASSTGTAWQDQRATHARHRSAAPPSKSRT